MMKKVFVIFLFSMFTIVSCDSQETEQSTKAVDVPVKEKVNVVENTQRAVEKIEKDMTENMAKVQAAVPVAKVSMTGEQVYKKSCFVCHASGTAGAPKLGDVAAWEPRVNKGMEGLYQSALKGVPGTAMTAKGTCSACNDKELQAAVDYMVSKVN